MEYKKLEFNLDKRIVYENKEQILSYMKKGTCIGALAGSYKDPITGKYIKDNNVYSDGEYQWNGLTIYLVEKYSIELEKNFINKTIKKFNHRFYLSNKWGR